MKKYIALASILALVACGGGGGGGGSGQRGASPVTVREAVSDDALTSNAAITSMASEVLVPKGGGDIVVNRTGSVNIDGLSYTSYRLDDVNFRIATGGGGNPTLHFRMDNNGRIDSLIVNAGGGKQKLFRNGETSDFRGIVYEYIVLDDNASGHNDYAASDKETIARLVYSIDDDPATFADLHAAANGRDKCPKDKKCRWDRIDQAFRITAQGGTDELTYSDFGMLQTTNFGKYKGVTEDNFDNAKTHNRGKDGVETDAVADWDGLEFDDADYDVFAGGYKVAALQHRPTSDMHFKGKAIGSVYATNDDNHHHANAALVDNAATLDFVGGVETLNMAFNNWYDVTVTKNGSSQSIAFSNFNGTPGDDGNQFRTDTGDGLTVNNFTTSTNANGVKREGMLDMGYYGLAGPEEATGVVRFKETTNEGTGDDAVQYEREFRAGYGMKPYTPSNPE